MQRRTQKRRPIPRNSMIGQGGRHRPNRRREANRRHLDAQHPDDASADSFGESLRSKRRGVENESRGSGPSSAGVMSLQAPAEPLVRVDIKRRWASFSWAAAPRLGHGPGAELLHVAAAVPAVRHSRSDRHFARRKRREQHGDDQRQDLRRNPPRLFDHPATRRRFPLPPARIIFSYAAEPGKPAAAGAVNAAAAEICRQTPPGRDRLVLGSSPRS